MINNIKVGTKLIAVNPCVMSESRASALIVGKTYVVKRVNHDTFIIHSEISPSHLFDFETVGTKGHEVYFTLFHSRNIFKKIQ